jgi:alpha-aminoadipic semialdehyde synthase
MLLAIRREDLDKRGEQRVALTPAQVAALIEQGHAVLVQPARHPETGDIKRAFADEAYAAVGATINEDLSAAQVIIGLKEVGKERLLPGKTYLMFSHTHKGQVKNRPTLQVMRERGLTLMDYELITDPAGRRRLTAFTYFAGYAGLTDSLWTLGQRLRLRGIDHPFSAIPQSIDAGDLDTVKAILGQVAARIRSEGTPAALPPLITTFLGNGKTSAGAQEMYDLLPVQAITLAELPAVFAQGNRHQVYKLVLEVSDMFRVKADSPLAEESLSPAAQYEQYLTQPQHFESNLDQVFPYTTLLMNCIIWSPEFPRLITRDQAAQWYADDQTLEVIGDITCDPEGAIQFSEETWIDEPVLVYDPATRTRRMGFEGEGIAVMAVTNLPCEFSMDASTRFAQELEPLLSCLAEADYEAADPEAAGLPVELQEATILWRGAFTPRYAYMQAYTPAPET